jgi:two-component system, OmpR family, KDP operon response regulator KdpE
VPPAEAKGYRSVKKERVLVVDDEASIRLALTRALSARGYEVEAAVDGQEALAIFESFSPDLVVLDLNMPELDGFGVCKKLRTWSSVPIIVLSVREDESDKVEALDLGADDYLTKPFGIDELLARVRAQLRRTKDARETPHYSSGGLKIDLGERRVTRDGADVRLTKTEWALLEELARHPGKLLTHNWLLDHVWGSGYTDDVDVLRVFVSQLRHKSEADPARPSIIVTEPGVGYRWTSRPERAAPKDTSAG